MKYASKMNAEKNSFTLALFYTVFLLIEALLIGGGCENEGDVMSHRVWPIVSKWL